MRPFGKELKCLTEGSQSSSFTDPVLLPKLLEHRQERICLGARDSRQGVSVQRKHPQTVQTLQPQADWRTDLTCLHFDSCHLLKLDSQPPGLLAVSSNWSLCSTWHMRQQDASVLLRIMSCTAPWIWNDPAGCKPMLNLHTRQQHNGTVISSFAAAAIPN